MDSPRIPITTYRLQFNSQFRFKDARKAVPYLEQLGVTDVYASPLFKARKGSQHGYNVTDHTRLNPELGRESEFRKLAGALQERQMGLVLDLVPNHMDVATDSNRYWNDVLENGPSSPYARFFDIDWSPPKPDLVNTVLLPILGEQYGVVLEKGELRVVYEQGTFKIQVYDRRLPLAPRSWSYVLELVRDMLIKTLPTDDAHLNELESILTALRNLPPRTETSPDKVRERRREKEVARRRFSALLEASDPVREELQHVMTRVNGSAGDPRSFDALEELLAEQAFRLSHWQVASDEINYRRFFDVNDLGAIRVEEPEVFKIVHGLVFRLIGEGRVTGLRIDHPDGLFDPEQYYLDLQEGCRRARLESQDASTSSSTQKPFYVVAEKILDVDEELSPTWAVHGTTGYDFLNDLNGIFVNREAALRIRDVYARFTDRIARFDDLIYHAKRLILDVSMSSELRVLARRLDRISEQHRSSRDFTLSSLRTALREIISCFPVYRTYVRAQSETVSAIDRGHIEKAVREARRRNPVLSNLLFDFVARVLLLEDPDGLSRIEREERLDFVLRFQQLTAPVMAKGVEDTAFYRAFPLASLNEVGGDPERFGVSLEDFHRRNTERLTRWPHSMLATSTHDTKRSEDVRARINVLSEMPDEWQEAIRRWRSLNHAKKVVLDGAEVPDTREEYLLYQTLVGVWPLAFVRNERQEFQERMEAYIDKATREAKLHTSWINPNLPYEEAVKDFLRKILSPADNPFLEDFLGFVRRIEGAGAVNALGQTLLKITSPGTPDFYQGTELWSFHLVDPDNRHPVDYGKRASMLDKIQRKEKSHALVEDLVQNWRDGRIKMYTTYRGLELRRRRHKVFLEGEYHALEAEGDLAPNVCGMARAHDRQWVIAVVPRLCAHLASADRFPLGSDVWGDTKLRIPQTAPREWVDAFTGDTHQTRPDSTLALADLFGSFPIALLEG